ncbi:heparinase II/III domain-containing protein [Luteimicrobium sp. DT211]|uniref:heparinase II/III domain-containing protein n=1 Tax=Luteimicrobium sp. DT211 TaxID=3393412 RepID=UPI003CF45D16
MSAHTTSPGRAATAGGSFAGPLATRWGTDRARLREALRDPARALAVPPATDRTAWTERALDAVTLDRVEALGAATAGTPWPQPLARDYARYHRDGDRVTYEAAVFARAERLTVATVLAARTLDDAWLDEVADGVVLLCEQSTWCWPAHDDTRARHGSVLPTVTDPYLDLGAGEVVGQLAWIDHLLGEALDARVPGLRARIRHESRVRVLDPFVGRRDWHWLGLDGDVHNWNPWIHGNVLVAALRLVDDPDERATIVGLVVEGLDRYVASLPDDGAIDEGFHYWWNGACRALEALEALAHATDGALDARDLPCLRETVAFPHRMHLGGDWFVNHADGPARISDELPWRELHRAAARVSDGDARALAASRRRSGAPVTAPAHGLGRVLRALTDPAWRDAAASEPPLPRDVWLGSTQVLVARRRAGSAAGLTLVAKGGHNGEHHNHDDVGSFVVAVDGVPAVVDAGRPTYTAQTFGPDRYLIRAMQSSWHNVPEVRGTPQATGAEHAARDVVATLDDAAALALDLADCYPGAGLRTWRRTARLDRSVGRVTVNDTWELEPRDAEAPTELHLLCAGDVTTTPGTATVRPGPGGATVVLRWPPDLAVRVDEWTLDDPWLSESWGDRLTRLAIDVSHVRSTDVTIVIEEATQP